MRLTPLIIVLWTASVAFGAQKATKPHKPDPQKASANTAVARSRRFVLDVVRSAVGVQEPDPQDRLRVLATAVPVVMNIDPKLAADLTKEGVKLETQLVAQGQQPSVSLLAAGYASCADAAEFVGQIYPATLQLAEQALIGAFSKCPKETGDTLRMRVDAALDQRILTPRLLLGLMESAGADSDWTRQHFEKMFGALPSDPNVARKQAPEIANAYAQMAPQLDKDLLRDTGVTLLAWLGKLDESGERNLAINSTVAAMADVLGEEKFHAALEKDVMAQQAANLAGQSAEVSQDDTESVTVQDAMAARGSDKSEELGGMAPTRRAREAAAHGFAAGTGGDPQSAGRYFDIAFSAADEAWSGRNSETSKQNIADIIEEVCEAAAQVDPVNALSRAQALSDPTARAIGMIAVARVVLSNGSNPLGGQNPS